MLTSNEMEHFKFTEREQFTISFSSTPIGIQYESNDKKIQTARPEEESGILSF